MWGAAARRRLGNRRRANHILNQSKYSTPYNPGCLQICVGATRQNPQTWDILVCQFNKPKPKTKTKTKNRSSRQVFGHGPGLVFPLYRTHISFKISHIFADSPGPTLVT